MRIRALAAGIQIAIPLLWPLHLLAADVDTDNDGLSDFQETHKYLTNPQKADSDGDGRPDSEWDERREYTYTVRTILRVVPSVTPAFLSDDYQDARVLAESDSYVELEVIHYPFNTVASAIEANPNWRVEYEGMAELAPGITTNWDAEMRAELIAALTADGIDIRRLSDREVVQKVSTWVLERAPSSNYFNAFHIYYPNGRPAVLPGREDSVENDKGAPEWSFREQIEHEILGKQMYENRARGTCTSSAVLMTTVLRAVGIPTRMVICTPLVDASNADNLELVRRGLAHHQLRALVVENLEALGQSNASHTFNEVFVGNRWRRLNYNQLDQNTLDRELFGILTHTHTFNDLSDVPLATTWGSAKRREPLGGINAYTATHVSDLFGAHAQVDNLPAGAGLRVLTISAVRWLGDPDLPQCVVGARFDQDGSGHLFLHVAESAFGATMSQYGRFYEAVSKAFVLTSPDQPPVAARAERGFWLDTGSNCREFYLRIPANEMKKLRPGVQYELVPTAGNSDVRWQVGPAVRISKS